MHRSDSWQISEVYLSPYHTLRLAVGLGEGKPVVNQWKCFDCISLLFKLQHNKNTRDFSISFYNKNRLMNILKVLTSCKAKHTKNNQVESVIIIYHCKYDSIKWSAGLYWDFCRWFTASSALLTKVSVSFIKPLALMKNGGESRRKERSGKGQGSLITPPYFKVWTLPSMSRTATLWMNNLRVNVVGKLLSLRSRVGKIIKNQT